jgi:predicted XRE-type DNA-binding protein
VDGEDPLAVSQARVSEALRVSQARVSQAEVSQAWVFQVLKVAQAVEYNLCNTF